MTTLLQIYFLWLSFTAIAHAQFAEKHMVELFFEKPGYVEEKKELLYKWYRTIVFREDFHFFLDHAPLKEGYLTGSIAGVINSKKDGLYCSLSLEADKDLKLEAPDNSYSIGATRFFKVPKSMKFELPLSKDSGFQKCTVTLVPVKG